MKNILAAVFLSVLCIGYTPNTQAQEGYEGKKLYLDLGVGLSRYGFVDNYLYNYYGYDRYSLPTLRANLEYGFNHFISGGLYAGYNHYGYKGTDIYNSLEYEYRNHTSYFSVGARATFHIWAFLNNHLDLGLGVNQLDLYASVMTGIRVKTHTTKDLSKTSTKRTFGGHFGPTVGAKYYFVNNMAVFAEGGYGSSSFGVFGITFKF
nr:hypothetical protein [uncultured Brumimicrobium sp.]